MNLTICKIRVIALNQSTDFAANDCFVLSASGDLLHKDTMNVDAKQTSSLTVK